MGYASAMNRIRLIAFCVGFIGLQSGLIFPGCGAESSAGAATESSGAAVAESGPAKPADGPAGVVIPVQATPIIKFDDVRIGMKGYGLTVFEGTKIESFAVEVTSVMRDFEPGKGAIWIRCTDERMRHSGPVSGMSGSPIYLWELGQEGKLGEGGRLAGAFAFGYSLSRQDTCYAGVQPIEQMRDVATRENRDEKTARDPDGARVPARGVGLPATRALLGAGRRANVPAWQSWRAKAIAELMPQSLAEAEVAGGQEAGASKALLLPLMLPLANVPEWCRQLWSPLGVMPVAGGSGGNMVAGKPPVEIDPDQITISPGSVLSVPLLWGDKELAAVGTVTDVLPNGQVLGFGHAFTGEGKIDVPMAGGFVHFVQPNVVSSFKLGGSGRILGTLGRDENSAVIGSPGLRYQTIPIQVAVNLQGQPARVYHYQAVQHPKFTSQVVISALMMSLGATQNLPTENTLRLSGTLRFEDQPPLSLNAVMPMGSDMAIAMELFPLLEMLSNNPYRECRLEAVDVRLDATEQVQLIMLTDAAVDTLEPEQGQDVRLTVKTQAYKGQVQERTLRLKIPDTLEEGEYPLILCGADQYLNHVLESRPYLADISSLEDLLATLRVISEIRSDALYVILRKPAAGLAVGRTELPQLPSSRAAMLASPTHSYALPCAELIVKVEPAAGVVAGEQYFMLNVKRHQKYKTNDTESSPK
ncbi:MAG: hypothetical protein IT443_13770 [Phycisphaeraceae bacterium]|nr:hypothetical protein [Phycisphaeraceae bacterium]